MDARAGPGVKSMIKIKKKREMEEESHEGSSLSTRAAGTGGLVRDDVGEYA